ncbi:HNH endonuclease [Brucella pituitosa]|uniref:HNH endonuclease n=1 Tax=Brucella pituitosa TaxID=571256 RepID=UPI003C73D0D3
MTLTQKRLREVLHYNPWTGIFTWRQRQELSANWNERWANKVAGSVNDRGYILIRVEYKRYRAHRLAYLYLKNYMPDEVDHIDHCRGNNAFSNLRDANRSTNGKNVSMHSTNTSGVTGVHWDKRKGKWVAQITVDGDVKYLGGYDSIDAAKRVRTAANDKYNFHNNHGKSEYMVGSA